MKNSFGLRKKNILICKINIMSIHISEKDLLHSGAYGIISRYLIHGSTRYQVEGSAKDIILDLQMSLDGGQRDNQGI